MSDDKGKQLCELTMLNQPSDNILSSRVFIERLNESHKAFLKLILSDAATLKEITTRTVIKVDQFESTFGKTFKELVSSGDHGEMTWWILRTRGTKGLGVIGLTQDDHNKVITVEQLVRPEIQNTTLAAEALYTLAKVYEEVARRNNTLSAYYEYKLIVTSSVAESIEELMDSFTFNKHYLANGKIQYEMKTGDFYNSNTYKQKSGNLRRVELTNGSKVPPNQIDLVLYTQLHHRKFIPFPYRGIVNFTFNPVWKKDKVYNSLPALGCNKQHLIGTVSIQPSNAAINTLLNASGGVNWLECYLCVYLVKSGVTGPNSIVYQAKRNKRDGYPLVFSQFGFKKVNNTYVSEIKLQPKSQALDENGKHARIYCLIELWHNLTKLDQYETDEFFTHSEDRRKKSGASVPPVISTDADGRVCVEGAPNTPTSSTSSSTMSPSTPNHKMLNAFSTASSSTSTTTPTTTTTTTRRRASDTAKPYVPNGGGSPSNCSSTAPPTSPSDIDRYHHSTHHHHQHHHSSVMAASVPTLPTHSTPYMWNTRNNPPYTGDAYPPPHSSSSTTTATTTASSSNSTGPMQGSTLKGGESTDSVQQNQLPSIHSLFKFVDHSTQPSTTASVPSASDMSDDLSGSEATSSTVETETATPVVTQKQYQQDPPPSFTVATTTAPPAANCYSCTAAPSPVSSGYGYPHATHHHHQHHHPSPGHICSGHSCSGYVQHHQQQHTHPSCAGAYHHPQHHQTAPPPHPYYANHYHPQHHPHVAHYSSSVHHRPHYPVYEQQQGGPHPQHYPHPPPPHYGAPPPPPQHFPHHPQHQTTGYATSGTVGYPNGGIPTEFTAHSQRYNTSMPSRETTLAPRSFCHNQSY